MGAAPSNFYMTYRLTKTCQRTPQCDGAPPTKYNRENLKFGLKFSVWAPITSRLVGVSSQNFFQATWRKAGVIKWVQLLGDLPPKIWEGEKTSKIRSAIWQLSSLIANISGTHRHITNRKRILSTRAPSTFGEKTMWTFVQTNKKVIGAHIDQLKRTFCGRLHFGIWEGEGGAAPSNF